MEKSFIASKDSHNTFQDLVQAEGDVSGNLYRFRARLVAEGFFPEKEVDYSEMVAAAVPFQVVLLLAEKFASD